MFEIWRRFDTRKVAALLRQHRKLLQDELRTIKVLLGAPTETDYAIVAERTRSLGQHYTRALNDHIEASKAIRRSITFLDLLKFVDVVKAQSDLLATTSAVYQFLAERALPARGNTPSKVFCESHSAGGHSSNQPDT
jgi:hypothetical protein